jgi:glycosyltransferase involved in cell wall biosynthesis
MDTSIILPVYNNEDTIKKCLSSLVNIKEAKEIIIIDDGSSDKTENIIKSRNLFFPYIIIFSFFRIFWINKGITLLLKSYIP